MIIEMVPKIIEIAKKIEVPSDMLAASKIAASDSCGGMFSAFAGDQGGWSGTSKNRTRMRPTPAEKTEEYCVSETA
jgi:hypothetical protein